MKYSDLLRQIADQLDVPQDNIPEPQAKMMPPQTQELELLKKQAGVESEYDASTETDCGCSDAEPDMENQIAQIRKLAGI